MAWILSLRGVLGSITNGPGLTFTPRLPLWGYLGEEDPLWAAIKRAALPALCSKPRANSARRQSSPRSNDEEGEEENKETNAARPSLASSSLPIVTTLLPSFCRSVPVPGATATATTTGATVGVGGRVRGKEGSSTGTGMGMFALSVALYYFSYDHITAPTLQAQGQGPDQNSSGAGRVLVSLPCDLEGSAWRKDEKERDMLELNRIKVGLPYLSATDDASISTITTATATATGG